MKKIIALFIVLCISMFAAMSVSAAASTAPAVTDDADLLRSSDEEKLEEMILEIREEYDCDVAVYTYRFSDNFVSDGEARTQAEEFYNRAGFSDDGILLMIYFEADDDGTVNCSGGGGTEIIATGKCIDVFTEDVMIEMEDNFYGYLSKRTKDGYFEAAESFVTDCEAEFYDYTHFDLIWFLIAPIVGAVIAFIAVGSMKSELKSVRSKPNASDYTKSGSMKLTSSSDIFLYRRVTKTPRPKDNCGSSYRGSGGRSFSGHSGSRF